MSGEGVVNQRSLIRKWFALYIRQLFGPSGSNEVMFRKVDDTGMWSPGDATTPRCSVIIDGNRKKGDQDPETEKTLECDMAVVINLNEDWRAKYETWEAHVQKIITTLYNTVPAGLGVSGCAYVDDDPFTITLRSGSSAQTWIINFRITYYTWVGELTTVTLEE